MSRAKPRFGYQPALDGVRGLAVALVLCFHAGFGWMPGGYVGVSVFFTLSGFLITTLALREHGATGRLDVPAFYGRRLRRLLPASVACVAGVLMIAAFGGFEGAEGLRRNAVAALAQVFNWAALTDGRSYADVIGGGARLAPLDHYWSLAIEEQFYWLWPLALLVILRLPRRGRITVVAVITIIAAAAAPLIAWRWGSAAAYWATPARLAEILVGASLAVVLDQRWAARRRLPRWVRGLAPVGLLAIVGAAATWPSDSGPAYRGWMPLFAVASAALILGLQVDGPVRRALAHPALVSLGVISYGVYLYHWPVFGLLDEQRLGWGRAPLFALRVGVTLAVATASFLWLEEPIRRHRWSLRQSLYGAVAVTVPVAVAALLLPIERPGFWAGSADAREEVEIDPNAPLTPVVPGGDGSDTDVVPTESSDAEPGVEATATAGPTTTNRRSTTTTDPPRPNATTTSTTRPADPTTTTTTTTTTTQLLGAGADVPGIPETLSRPARVLVVGDSTASALGEGLVKFAADRPELAQVSIRWSPACGFVRTGNAVGDLDEQFNGGCQMIRAALPDDIRELQPDVVVLMQTIADATARDFGDGRTTLAPSDPGFADFLAAEYEAQLSDLLAWGADDVVWIIQPPQRLLTGGVIGVEAQPAIRAAIEQAAANHPDVVTVVDLETWQSRQPDDLRPDGLHFSADGAARVATELLGPVVVQLAAS